MEAQDSQGGQASSDGISGTDPAKAIVKAPVSGRVVPLKDVPDPVFNSGMLGQGCGIWPEENYLRAPFDGVVSSISHTNHGIVLTSDAGVQCIVHVGIDTCEMQGKGFARLVEKGQHFSEGDPLMRFSIDAIRKSGYREIVVCVVLNSEQYREIDLVPEEGHVAAGEPLLLAEAAA
ncbi:MAG: PTS glucose transporter subunit IIA [Atopobiaceae bacterium]